MKDLVLIPSNYRPEFLYTTLDFLRKADGGPEKHVWIAQDQHHSDLTTKMHLLNEVRYVVKLFEGSFEKLRYSERQPHSYTGNPYNFLELYKAAYLEPDVRYVYLVEDDVIVGKDFFRWHEAVQKEFVLNILASVAWHCTRNKTVKPTDDPNALILSARDFTSVGVCWPRHNLNVVAQHARHEYYGDLSGYMRQAFPGSPMPHHKWTEQAGLMMRITLQQQGRKYVVWPGLRRCSHIGVNGYHRRNGFQFTGRLQEKIQKLAAVIHSTEAMRKLSPELYDDIDELPPLKDWKPENLYVVKNIGYDGSYE